MSFLGDIGTGITGKTDKAVIYIRKDQEAAEEKRTGMTALKSLTNDKTSTTDLQSLKDFADSLSADEYDPSALLGGDFISFPVQYNPKSIHFDCVAGEMNFERGVGGGNEQTISSKVNAQINFSFELIFQDVDVLDAFGQDTLSKTMNSLNNISVSTVTSLFSSTEHSVQKQVDGLISLVSDKDTDLVVFHWADMTFIGNIKSVNATYDMFSNSGKPISAKVRIVMTDGGCGDLGVQVNTYWDNRFNEIFGEAGTETTVTMKQDSNSFTNNFLNI